MTDLSPEAKRVIDQLTVNRCALLQGPPGTGKTRVLAEIRRAFAPNTSKPVVDLTAQVPIPAAGASGGTALSPSHHQRKVFSLTMHPGVKLRDCWRGLAVRPGTTQELYVTEGIFDQANKHARTPNGASLLIIEEFNRGPIVEMIGPALTAIEGDKRLLEDGAVGPDSEPFMLLDDAGNEVPEHLSAHLYIVGVQNQADTSVETIDTALLRRMGPVDLHPDPSVLTKHFGISDLDADLPDAPADAGDVYRAAIRAWVRVNQNIGIGAGLHFRLGHGVFIKSAAKPAADGDANAALRHVALGWDALERHVDEVFFGNDTLQAAALMVDRPGHPYELATNTFGTLQIERLKKPAVREPATLWKVLRALGTAE